MTDSDYTSKPAIFSDIHEQPTGELRWLEIKSHLPKNYGPVMRLQQAWRVATYIDDWLQRNEIVWRDVPIVKEE